MEKAVKTDSNRSEDKSKKNSKEQDRNGSTVLSLCGNLYLVFEFVEHDLGGLLDAKYKFSMREVKCIAKQLLEVLEYLSEKKILHRDIKSSNILITNRHHVKLADFGLARSIQSADGRDLRLDLTNNVVTMWYKAPELLLGAVRYAHSIDVWSTGCVLAELELGRPLFPGRTEIEQMDLICRTLGTPSESLWTGVQKMPSFDTIMPSITEYSSSLRTAFSGKLSDAILGLLERILVFDPTRRGSAKILLTNKYFLTQPLPPVDPSDLDPLNVTAGVSYHEYRTKQQKRQREQESKDDSQDKDKATDQDKPQAKHCSIDSVPRPPPPRPLSMPMMLHGGSAAGNTGPVPVAAYGAPILPAEAISMGIPNLLRDPNEISAVPQLAPYGGYAPYGAAIAPIHPAAATVAAGGFTSTNTYGQNITLHASAAPPMPGFSSFSSGSAGGGGGGRFSGIPQNQGRGHGALPPRGAHIPGTGASTIASVSTTSQNGMRFNQSYHQAHSGGYGGALAHKSHNINNNYSNNSMQNVGGRGYSNNMQPPSQHQQQWNSQQYSQAQPINPHQQQHQQISNYNNNNQHQQHHHHSQQQHHNQQQQHQQQWGQPYKK